MGANGQNQAQKGIVGLACFFLSIWNEGLGHAGRVYTSPHGNIVTCYIAIWCATVM